MRVPHHSDQLGGGPDDSDGLARWRLVTGWREKAAQAVSPNREKIGDIGSSLMTDPRSPMTLDRKSGGRTLR